MSDWCTIESDPGVFTELIKGIGVKGVGVEEIYSLDDEETIKSLSPIHGFIFLFKWVKETEKPKCLEFYDTDLFFANQEVTNACATQAILSVLLNAEGVDIGPVLRDFKDITHDMDPQLKGLALGENDIIKKVHNSFARPEPFVISHDKKSKKEGDAYHFVGYVPHKGKLYELDGLQKGPILLGDCTKENWVNVAKDEINKRIVRYATNEIRFTLLAVVGNKKEKLEKEIDDLNIQKGQVLKRYKELGGVLDSEANKEADELIAKSQGKNSIDISGDKSAILTKLSDINSQIAAKKMEIQEEEAKHKQYEEENIRRRHNYIPFIVELLKMTAKKGKLKELVDAAKEKQKARNASKNANRK